MSTITIPVKTIEEVERSLTNALKQIRQFKPTQKAKAPRFWTKKEWAQSEKQADEDIAAGRVYRLDKIEDLDKPLDELVKISR